MERINRRIVLARRPDGPVTEDCFGSDEVAVPQLGDGQALIGNSHVGMDPTIRQWLGERGNYLPPVEIGEVVRGAAIGRVVESRADRFPTGALVTTLTGWEEWSVIHTDDMTANVVPDGDPTQLISIMGGTSVTAWLGVTEIAKPAVGETVVVSAAAGSVGSVVGQLAKAAGARVVGIAGSADKCAWLADELGFDATIDYKSAELAPALREAAPDGADVVWDNVGGMILDAMLRRLARRARVILCGNISTYDGGGEQPRTSAFEQIMARRATVHGFNTIDHLDRYLDGVMAVTTLVEDGTIKGRVHLLEGLDRCPEALIRMFSGDHLGKLVVSI